MKYQPKEGEIHRVRLELMDIFYDADRKLYHFVPITSVPNLSSQSIILGEEDIIENEDAELKALEKESR